MDTGTELRVAPSAAAAATCGPGVPAGSGATVHATRRGTGDGSVRAC